MRLQHSFAQIDVEPRTQAVMDSLPVVAAAPDGFRLLWLDPEAQFQRLLPDLDPNLAMHGVRLLRYTLGGVPGSACPTRTASTS